MMTKIGLIIWNAPRHPEYWVGVTAALIISNLTIYLMMRG